MGQYTFELTSHTCRMPFRLLHMVPSWTHRPVALRTDPSTGLLWTQEFELSDDNIVVPNDLYDALNSTPWHNSGFTGENVKIAVFDVEWIGAEWSNGDLGSVDTHDCFAHPSCELPIDNTHPRFGFERGVHGLACAEVIWRHRTRFRDSSGTRTGTDLIGNGLIGRFERT